MKDRMKGGFLFAFPPYEFTMANMVVPPVLV